jgi:AAA+ superfamily predicted ATPase
MLEQTDAVVVLFDEFDELVRERGAKAEQPFSRLLTTSMLPKLARLRKRGTLVFIIATNNISEFDLAISRRGRFDKVFQVMSPAFEEKLKFTKWGPDKNISINTIFTELDVKIDDDVKRQLGELTFDETDALAVKLAKAKDSQQAIKTLNQQWADSTMQKKVPQTQSAHEEEISWAERCRLEAGFSR